MSERIALRCPRCGDYKDAALLALTPEASAAYVQWLATGGEAPVLGVAQCVTPCLTPAQRRELALTVARIRLRSDKDPPQISTENINLICREFVELHAATFCFHGVRFTDECEKCAEEA